MRFKAKTEEDIAMENLIPAGIYEATVRDADDTVSKAGNDMITLTLRVRDSDGNPCELKDYLLEKMAYKLIHFCRAAGLMEKYNDGELTAADCVGAEVFAEVEIQDARGDYPAKNQIKDYHDMNAEHAASPKAGADDDLPF